MYYRLEAKNIGDWSSDCKQDITKQTTTHINGNVLLIPTATRCNTITNGMVTPKTSKKDNTDIHGLDQPEWISL